MHAWILTSKTFPRTGLLVEIKFSNESTARAMIIENEYSESVWETEDGKIAHLQDYTLAEMKRFKIHTRADLKAPVAWRRIDAHEAGENV